MKVNTTLTFPLLLISSQGIVAIENLGHPSFHVVTLSLLIRRRVTISDNLAHRREMR